MSCISRPPNLRCNANSSGYKSQWWLCWQCSRMEGHSRTTKIHWGDEKSEIVPLLLWVFTSLLNNDFFFKEKVNHAVHLLYIYWFSSCRNDFVWAGSVSVTDPWVFLLIDLHRFMNTRLIPFHIFSCSVIISIDTFNKDVIVFSSLCNFLFVKHQK